MNKLKRLALTSAIAFAGGMAFATTATATQTDPVNFSNSVIQFDLGSVTDFTATINSAFTTKGNINETYNGGYDLTGASLRFLSQGSFSDLSGGSFKDSNNIISSSGNGANKINQYSDVGTLKFSSLQAGTYQLVLAGTGTAAGNYSLGYTAVSPVPEPATYAMFFAGLAVLGCVVARKSKLDKKTFGTESFSMA